jgi:hypothetical protein
MKLSAVESLVRVDLYDVEVGWEDPAGGCVYSVILRSKYAQTQYNRIVILEDLHQTSGAYQPFSIDCDGKRTFSTGSWAAVEVEIKRMMSVETLVGTTCIECHSLRLRTELESCLRCGRPIEEGGDPGPRLFTSEELQTARSLALTKPQLALLLSEYP